MRRKEGRGGRRDEESEKIKKLNTEELHLFASSLIKNRTLSSFFESPDSLPFVRLLEQLWFVRPRLYQNSPRSFHFFGPVTTASIEFSLKSW